MLISGEIGNRSDIRAVFIDYLDTFLSADVAVEIVGGELDYTPMDYNFDDF